VTTLLEASRLALEALKNIADYDGLADARAALRRALEQQPADEPVAWWVNSRHEGDVLFDEAEACRYALTINGSVTPLYNRSKPFVWIGLLDEEIKQANRQAMSVPVEEIMPTFARAIEAMLREKNGGKSPRQPLTDEQRREIAFRWRDGNGTASEIIDMVEAAHGITKE
jgi:hypothetical protein